MPEITDVNEEQNMNIADAEKLATDLMTKYITDRSWKFKWHNGSTCLGKVTYSSKVLSLCKPFVELNTDEHVRDVILHEIAHILVGQGHHHNHIWKDAAKSIGCISHNRLHIRTEYKTPYVSPSHITKRVVYTCKTCGTEFKFGKKLTKRYSCSKCTSSREFDANRELVFLRINGR